MIISDYRKVRTDYTSDGILHSCIVTLRLGEYRDVVLGLKDEAHYRRQGSDFCIDADSIPEYITAEDMLAVVYPKGSVISNNIYFNLKGCGVGNIEDHNLTINSGRFFYEGDIIDVTDTPLDFRKETPIAERIRVGYAPLVAMQGYDHVFLLDGYTREKAAGYEDVFSDREDGSRGIVTDRLSPAAVLLDRERTLEMTVYTNLPGIRLYTANRMSGRDIGKGGCIYPKRGGVALMPCMMDNSPLESDGICVYRFTPKEII